MRVKPLIPAVAIAGVLLGASPARAFGPTPAETETVIRQDTVIGDGASALVVTGAGPAHLGGTVAAAEVVIAGPRAAGARARPTAPAGPEWAAAPHLSAVAAPAPQRPTVAATAGRSRIPTRPRHLDAEIQPQRLHPIALEARPGQPRAPPR